ncbi:MAG TPA: MFS transporter [Stellaceae bacterium]|nr:MFS transporter [Stellaceae bacterium]
MPGYRLGAFYAALFFTQGVLLPFWPVWLSTRGLSPAEIGVVLAAAQWIKVAGNPLAGIAADRSGRPRRVMLWLSAVALLGFLLFLPARSFVALVLLSALTAGALSAVLPLGDNIALAAANAGEIDYGRVRLWGSLGFIAAALVAGRLIERAGADGVLYLLIAAAAAVPAACAGLVERARRLASGLALRAGLRRLPLLLFAAAAAIQGSHAVYYGFGTLYWQRLGLTDSAIAALWAEGVVAEILLFYASAPLLQRLRPAVMLALAGGAGVVRWSLTGIATALPALALLQLLHALTFAAAHLGAMHHLARVLPPQQAATGQALYSALVGGVGQGLALLLAGALFAAFGGAAYQAMAALAGLGLVLALRLKATNS